MQCCLPHEVHRVAVYSVYAPLRCFLIYFESHAASWCQARYLLVITSKFLPVHYISCDARLFVKGHYDKHRISVRFAILSVFFVSSQVPSQAGLVFFIVLSEFFCLRHFPGRPLASPACSFIGVQWS